MFLLLNKPLTPLDPIVNTSSTADECVHQNCRLSNNISKTKLRQKLCQNEGWEEEQTNNASIYGCQLISTGNNIIRAIYLNPAATEIKLAKPAPVANHFPMTKINLHLSPFLSRLCIHHLLDGLWLQNKF